MKQPINKESRAAAVEMQSPMEDFHMVGSGYDDKDPWQSLFIPPSRESKSGLA